MPHPTPTATTTPPFGLPTFAATYPTAGDVPRPHVRARYAAAGAAFGACFPLLAFTYVSLAGVVAPAPLPAWLAAAHRAEPLLWMIETAPCFLGLVAAIAGARQERLERANASLAVQVAERTASLESALARARAALREHQEAERALRRQADAFAAQAAVLERQALELAQANRQAERARLRAERASAARGDLLARLAHELRTPLHTIVGFAGVLGRRAARALGPTERLYLERIHDSGRHLAATLDDILDPARVQAELDREASAEDEARR